MHTEVLALLLNGVPSTFALEVKLRGGSSVALRILYSLYIGLWLLVVFVILDPVVFQSAGALLRACADVVTWIDLIDIVCAMGLIVGYSIRKEAGCNTQLIQVSHLVQECVSSSFEEHEWLMGLAP